MGSARLRAKHSVDNNAKTQSRKEQKMFWAALRLGKNDREDGSWRMRLPENVRFAVDGSARLRAERSVDNNAKTQSRKERKEQKMFSLRPWRLCVLARSIPKRPGEGVSPKEAP